MSTPAALVEPTIELADLVAPVLAENLYWFPVRHHSPAAAYYVAKAIATRKPACVLLEASTHLQHLVPYLLSKTKPPVALYSSARHDTRQSSDRVGTSWYPLLEYSPEWQAIQAADKIGAEIIFIDLPHYCQPSDEHEAPDDNSVSFFQSLADQTGHLNWHECWDALFERTIDIEDAEFDFNDFRQQLLYFAAAARHQANVEESPTLLARECYMWGNIKQALERHAAKDTMVVCGALHAFMARDESGFPEIQTQVNNATKTLSVNTTIVPYSYRRIAQQHGYGAGNRAPWFYYQMWRNKKQPQLRLIKHVSEVLSVARKLGQPISAADNIAVAHHAMLLAQLRHRQQPVLDDIEDAIWACCCKGDPAEQGSRIAKALNQANIGARIGTVNPDLGQLPLVNDFYAQLHLLQMELPALDEHRTVKCDLRTLDGLARSQFLHRLSYLKLPCAIELTQNRLAQATLFSESWTLTALGSEEMLIEYSEYGDNIDSVVQNKISRQIEKQLLEVDQLASTLLSSQAMGLGVFHGDIPLHFRNGLHTNGDFNTLARTFQCLLNIRNQQKYSDSTEPETEALLALCFLRAGIALSKLVSIPSNEQASFVTGLRVLAEAWQSPHNLTLDTALFEEHLINAASPENSALVHGCCFGLLLEFGMRTMTEFTQQLEIYTLSGSSESLIDAATWIEGVIYTTKVSILSGAECFSQGIDSLLRQASQQDFLIMLPRLRAGFEKIPRVQRETLAIAVGKMYGLASTGELKQLPTGYLQDLSDMDQQVQNIMEQWGLDS